MFLLWTGSVADLGIVHDYNLKFSKHVDQRVFIAFCSVRDTCTANQGHHSRWRVAGVVLTFSDAMRCYLHGVKLYSELMLYKHVNDAIRCCNYYTRALRHLYHSE